MLAPLFLKIAEIKEFIDAVRQLEYLVSSAFSYIDKSTYRCRQNQRSVVTNFDALSRYPGKSGMTRYSLRGAFLSAVVAFTLHSTNSLAQEYKVFPPDNCTPGQWRPLGWNEQSNVQCLAIPTCVNSQALNYDGTSFVCVPICSASQTLIFKSGIYSCCSPQTVITNSVACPSPELDTIDTLQVTDCSGNVTTSTQNNCYVNILSTQSQCDIGATRWGLVQEGIFTPCSELPVADHGQCLHYLCTDSGLVPQ